MGVKVSDRELSRAEYVEKLRQLNEAVGYATSNSPRKLMSTYGDRLVQAALDAYVHAMAANSVYVSGGVHAEHDHLLRRGHLMEARGCVDAVAALAYIHLDMVAEDWRRKGDSAKRNKALSRMERIGNLCAECSKLISGVMKWDYDQYKRYNEG